jgi:outer membrane protein
MPMSSRAAWALGLGLFGAALLAGQSHGQNNPADSSVRKTSNAQSATAPQLLEPARIGWIDLDKVMREYKKVKFTSAEFTKDAEKKRIQLDRLNSELRQVTKELEAMAPNSNDFKAKESKFTQLKAQLDAEQNQAQIEFARREAELLGTIYKEVQDMAAAVARYKKMSYVMRVSNESITAAEPKSVIAAMARTVVYADPKCDITEMVILNLNDRYERINPEAKAAAPAPASTAAGNGAATKTR